MSLTVEDVIQVIDLSLTIRLEAFHAQLNEAKGHQKQSLHHMIIELENIRNLVIGLSPTFIPPNDRARIAESLMMQMGQSPKDAVELTDEFLRRLKTPPVDKTDIDANPKEMKFGMGTASKIDLPMGQGSTGHMLVDENGKLKWKPPPSEPELSAPDTFKVTCKQ